MVFIILPHLIVGLTRSIHKSRGEDNGLRLAIEALKIRFEEIQNILGDIQNRLDLTEIKRSESGTFAHPPHRLTERRQFSDILSSFFVVHDESQAANSDTILLGYEIVIHSSSGSAPERIVTSVERGRAIIQALEGQEEVGGYQPLEGHQVPEGRHVLQVNAIVQSNRNGSGDPQPRDPQPVKNIPVEVQPEDDKQDEEDDSFGTCKICFQNMIGVAFLCGHTCCMRCSDKMDRCHVCRAYVSHVLPIYF